MFEHDDLREETILDDSEEKAEETALDTTEPGTENPPDTEPAQEEPTYTVKYNGQEMQLPVSDLITSAQKGMNYDHVHDELLKIREESTKAKSEVEYLLTALNQYGYAGNLQEIADTLIAQSLEVEPDEVRKQREVLEAAEEARREAMAAQQEVERYRMQSVFSQDLAEIRRLDPHVHSLDELGDTFFRLRAAGIGNLEAYQLARKKGAAQIQQKPNGKDHLQTTGGNSSSGGLADIPRNELGFWQDSFPDDTPAKLKERYHRAMKRQGL